MSSHHRHGTYSGYLNGCRCTDCREANRVQVATDRRKARQLGLDVDDSRHGSRVGYEHWGCRCLACVDACRRSKRESERRRYVAHPRTPTPIRHGTLAGYDRCRPHCDLCRKARSDYDRAYRERRKGVLS